MFDTVPKCPLLSGARMPVTATMNSIAPKPTITPIRGATEGPVAPWQPPLNIRPAAHVQRWAVDLRKNGLLPDCGPDARVEAWHSADFDGDRTDRVQGSIAGGRGYDRQSDFRLHRHGAYDTGSAGQRLHRGIKLSARVDVAAMGPEEKESLTKAMRAINEVIGATLQL